MTANVARLLVSVPAAVLIAVAGCKNPGPTETGGVQIPRDAQDDVRAAEQQAKDEKTATPTDVRPDVRNSATLAAAPAAVRAAFDRDQPGATATALSTPTAASGGLLYRIGYTSPDGRPGFVTYSANGDVAAEGAPSAPQPAGNTSVPPLDRR